MRGTEEDDHPLYRCRGCDHVHEPSDRRDHPWRVDVSLCPECESIRLEVIRDYDGVVGDV